MTARTLISDVLKDIGKLGEGQPLSNDDAQYVLRRLNQWIDSLALEGLLIFTYLRTVKALASGTPSYTIGTGGSINIVRPDDIRPGDAKLIIDTTADPVTEIPIAVFTEQEYRAIPQKDLESPLVQGIYYDRAWTAGLGTIKLYPVPNVATTSLVLHTEVPLSQFADLTTDYTFPPGYPLFLRTNLPREIAPGFGKTLSQEQKDAAKDARAKVKRSNNRIDEASLPIGTPGTRHGQHFNIYTGESR